MKTIPRDTWLSDLELESYAHRPYYADFLAAYKTPRGHWSNLLIELIDFTIMAPKSQPSSLHDAWIEFTEELAAFARFTSRKNAGSNGATLRHLVIDLAERLAADGNPPNISRMAQVITSQIPQANYVETVRRLEYICSVTKTPLSTEGHLPFPITPTTDLFLKDTNHANS